MTCIWSGKRGKILNFSIYGGNYGLKINKVKLK
jgi:hypothetical protein